MKVLVEEGKARIDAKDGQGGTPLYVAAATGNQAAALFLLGKGADVEVRQCCPFHLYASHAVSFTCACGRSVCLPVPRFVR